MKRRATRLDVAEHVVSQHGLSYEEASAVVGTVLTGIVKSTSQFEMLILPGFGTFKVSHRKPFTTRHPQTGEEMEVPAIKSIAFKSAKGILDE